MQGFDVEDYFTAELIEGLAGELAALFAADSRSGIDSVDGILAQRASEPHSRHYIYAIAADAYRMAGVDGVRALASQVRSNTRGTARAYCLRALWRLANGNLPRVFSKIVRAPVAPEVQAASHVAISDLVVDSLGDLELARTFWGEFSRTDLGADPPLALFYVKLAGESQFTLTDKLVTDLEYLISQDLPEAEYQGFLTSNPSLLDVTAAEVRPLAPLGLEFKTDFVLRRHDGRYIVVEIEKPQDRLFTKGADFTKEFTHAVGQVLDFQQWVAENNPYAAKHFPGITTPDGIVILGRRSELDERRTRKLERWQFNSRAIEVLTFDDLAVRARYVLGSLRSSP
ncbi:hypothetical protein LK09_17620 [Microbacterium mangrovi]|uniref:Shedu protein SduA C-terminal domain-containing protein n=1 Tax=Microbacterium mangrovi TaxID=1348253 RepID=A0A0B2A2Q6_9MICO|nr:Shedu immune nuclease family protein [Microbacterium mangrovi]KHK95848.1 hypothetical protein LK09_17620 [Microbacterium mangrovi]